MRGTAVIKLLRAYGLRAIATEKLMSQTKTITTFANATQFNRAPKFPAHEQDSVATHYLLQKRSMFIQTQSTPNPASLMFVPGKPVMEEGKSGRNFASAREAMVSPLAKKLFQIDGVTQVFFGSDFVTVTKSEEYGWSVIKPDVFAAIMDFHSSKENLFYDAEAEVDALIHEDDDEVVAMIKELLETRIRPAVQEDGGDIQFAHWDADSGMVTLKMLGSLQWVPIFSSDTEKWGGKYAHALHTRGQGVQESEPEEGEVEGLKAFNDLEKHLSA